MLLPTEIQHFENLPTNIIHAFILDAVKGIKTDCSLGDEHEHYDDKCFPINKSIYYISMFGHNVETPFLALQDMLRKEYNVWYIISSNVIETDDTTISSMSVVYNPLAHR